MSVRIGVLAAVLLAALAVAVWRLSARSEGGSEAAGHGVVRGLAGGAKDASGARGAAGGTRGGPRERPVLRGVTGASTGTRPRPALRVSGVKGAFDGELRDAAWADAKEKSVRARLDSLLSGYDGVRVPKVECRTAHCSLLVVGARGEGRKNFQRFLAAVQDERGFYKRAVQLTLHDYRPAKDAKDESSVGVMLEYER